MNRGSRSAGRDKFRSILIPVFLLCLLIWQSGCGGPPGKEGLVRAYGTVTLDGEPLVDALVAFDHPKHPETLGRTDSNGYYEMAFTMSQEGAFVGENVVHFTTADDVTGTEERVPEQYLFGKSELMADVKEGGSPYDFDLKSAETPISD